MLSIEVSIVQHLGHSWSQEGGVDARKFGRLWYLLTAPFYSCVNWDQRMKITSTSRHIRHRTQTLPLVHFFCCPHSLPEMRKKKRKKNSPCAPDLDWLCWTNYHWQWWRKQSAPSSSGWGSWGTRGGQRANRWSPRAERGLFSHDSRALLCLAPRPCRSQRDTRKAWCSPFSAFVLLDFSVLRGVPKAEQNPKMPEMDRGPHSCWNKNKPLYLLGEFIKLKLFSLYFQVSPKMRVCHVKRQTEKQYSIVKRSNPGVWYTRIDTSFVSLRKLHTAASCASLRKLLNLSELSFLIHRY